MVRNLWHTANCPRTNVGSYLVIVLTMIYRDTWLIFFFLNEAITLSCLFHGLWLAQLESINAHGFFPPRFFYYISGEDYSQRHAVPLPGDLLSYIELSRDAVCYGFIKCSTCRNSVKRLSRRIPVRRCVLRKAQLGAVGTVHSHFDMTAAIGIRNTRGKELSRKQTNGIGLGHLHICATFLEDKHYSRRTSGITGGIDKYLTPILHKQSQMSKTHSSLMFSVR